MNHLGNRFDELRAGIRDQPLAISELAVHHMRAADAIVRCLDWIGYLGAAVSDAPATWLCPSYRFHQCQANLRVLEVMESTPYLTYRYRIPLLSGFWEP